MGNFFTVTTPGNNVVSSMTTTYTYDAQANVTSTTDPSGNTTIYGNVNGVNGYNISTYIGSSSCDG